MAPQKRDPISVEVTYATAEKQSLLTIEISEGATVKEAVEQSGILILYPDIDPDQQKVGIFSKQVSWDHILQAGDRIEIYRPLIIDPKTARRTRQGQTKS